MLTPISLEEANTLQLQALNEARLLRSKALAESVLPLYCVSMTVELSSEGIRKIVSYELFYKGKVTNHIFDESELSDNRNFYHDQLAYIPLNQGLNYITLTLSNKITQVPLFVEEI